jgi:hypothetical protein
MRVLDGELRSYLGGLGDISTPLEHLAGLALPVSHVLIVENLQTGLAIEDLPGTVVLTRLDQHCHGCIGECCDGLS